jgi:hypothetical protein
MDFSCLRNVVAMFHVLEKEMEWRKSTGRVEGFETMKKNKPIVAVGPEHSLEDECLMADYFREFFRSNPAAYHRWQTPLILGHACARIHTFMYYMHAQIRVLANSAFAQ